MEMTLASKKTRLIGLAEHKLERALTEPKCRRIPPDVSGCVEVVCNPNHNSGHDAHVYAAKNQNRSQRERHQPDVCPGGIGI